MSATTATITPGQHDSKMLEWFLLFFFSPSFVNSSRSISSVSKSPWCGEALHRLNWQQVKQCFEPSESVEKQLLMFLINSDRLFCLL